jgi:murein DD-endopeptidase MepM/ murein hydrolase activator NlpD
MEIQKPIKYRLWKGNLEARSDVDESWEPIFKTKSKQFLPITQRFGKNGVPFYKDLGLDGHNGIDWKAPIGTCLYAPVQGDIVFVRGDNNDGYGECIVILSNIFKVDDKEYRYAVIEAHLSEEYVNVGDHVLQGDLIGLTGNTGKYTTGPHLHEGFRLLERMRSGLTEHWAAPGWGYDNTNGYWGYINHKQFIKDINVKKNTLLEDNEGKYLQRTDTQHGGAGQVYKVVNGELVFLDSEKNPVTRHTPLVDEAITILNNAKLNKGITEKQFNNL